VVRFEGMLGECDYQLFWYTSLACLPGQPQAWGRYVLPETGLRIRVQHFRLNTNPDPDPIRIQGFIDQKLGKITAEKKIKFFFDPIPRPP
jgi:hypothetical protein